ncbi:hypothetical protein AB1484_24950 [Parafrankia sp. FMc6]|uniref:hypothetical protein n=1 Tax=Parafrankia soli TaxID=2599596 RepID=UPI0034D5C0D2
MPGGTVRESLNLRASPELRRRVEECVAEIGVSVNAAASVFLAAGLCVERRGW